MQHDGGAAFIIVANCVACVFDVLHAGIRYGHSVACIISFNCPYTCAPHRRTFILVPLQFPSLNSIAFPFHLTRHVRCVVRSVGISFISFYISSQSYKSIASKRNAMTMMMMMYGYVKDCTRHNAKHTKIHTNVLTVFWPPTEFQCECTLLHSAIKRWTIFRASHHAYKHIHSAPYCTTAFDFIPLCYILLSNCYFDAFFTIWNFFFFLPPIPLLPLLLLQILFAFSILFEFRWLQYINLDTNGFNRFCVSHKFRRKKTTECKYCRCLHICIRECVCVCIYNI